MIRGAGAVIILGASEAATRKQPLARLCATSRFNEQLGHPILSKAAARFSDGNVGMSTEFVLIV